MQDIQQTGSAIDRWFFWGFLGGVAAAETLTAAVDARAGVLFHLGLLIAALLYATLASRPAARNLAMALILAPLIRVLALTMPLPQLPQLAWYPAVALPLSIAIWLIIRQTDLGRDGMALRVRRPRIDLAIVFSGGCLGLIESVILKPQPIITPPTLGGLALSFVVLTVFTGLIEELIFRGILQTLGLRVLGAPALAFVALLFGVLHIGYLSLAELAFVIAVGMIFALAIHHGVSLYALTLAHGLTNFTQFTLVPLLKAGSLPPWAERGAWIALAASGVGLGALVFAAIIDWPTFKPLPPRSGEAAHNQVIAID